MKKYQYEIRQIDAWNSPEGWTWNTSYLLGTMTTSAENISKAMSRYLKQHHGIIFKANRPAPRPTEAFSRSSTGRPKNRYLQQSQCSNQPAFTGPRPAREPE